jgi:hypothetical protein
MSNCQLLVNINVGLNFESYIVGINLILFIRYLSLVKKTLITYSIIFIILTRKLSERTSMYNMIYNMSIYQIWVMLNGISNAVVKHTKNRNTNRNLMLLRALDSVCWIVNNPSIFVIYLGKWCWFGLLSVAVVVIDVLCLGLKGKMKLCYCWWWVWWFWWRE